MMRIGFIGAGKVGCTLGRYFVENNIELSGYYSKSSESSVFASEFTHTKCFMQLEDIVDSSDALFLTCPDGAIEGVWDSLKQYSLKGKCICHCSGAMSAAVFSEIDQMGAFGYSIHPLFAIHSKTDSFREISDSYFTIEGHEKYLESFVQLIGSCGNKVKVIRAKDKVKYHAAAVFVSNLVCALFDSGTELMEGCGFDKRSAREALKALFLNNAQSLSDKGAEKALTGPVERADAATVKKHLDILDEKKKRIYTDLSRVLVDIAERKNPQRDYGEINELLRCCQKGMENDEEHSIDL